MSAGEWWRLAGRVADLIADLEGTPPADVWSGPLQDLAGACLREAGARCVHEVRGFEHDREHDEPERRAA